MSKKKEYSFELKKEVLLKYFNEGYSLTQLSREYGIHTGLIETWRDVYLEHGDKGILPKVNKYSGKFKEEVLDYFYSHNKLYRKTAAHFNINMSSVKRWQTIYEREGVSGLYKLDGSQGMPKKKITYKRLKSREEELKEIENMSNDELKAKVDRLLLEIEVLKKSQALAHQINKTRKEQIELIDELKPTYDLQLLLSAFEVPISTYYYHVNRLKVGDKDKEYKELILAIYEEHKGLYGYRRITEELHNKGYIINHKKVKRLMNVLGIKGKYKPKKYQSFSGEVNNQVANVIDRDFKACKPLTKLATDVTQFNLLGLKCYLSAIIDMYNGEVISYTLSNHPTLELVMDMTYNTLSKIGKTEGVIIHSDQGVQYQHKAYQNLLKEHGIIQSMSRKGNCLDNAMIESFFGTLKNEFFYGNKFSSIEDFKNRLAEYIEYYNNVRIKSRLNGLSPVQYKLLYAQ